MLMKVSHPQELNLVVPPNHNNICHNSSSNNSSNSNSNSNSNNNVKQRLGIFEEVEKKNSCCTTTSILNSITAGYIAGVSGVIVGHPFESVKVWLQTNTHHNKYLMKHAAVGTSSSGSYLQGAVGKLVVKKGALSSTTSAAAAASASARAAAASAANMSTAVAVMAPSSSHLMQSLSYNNSVEQLRAVGRNVRALYSGVTGPLFTVGLVSSINFAIYDSSRRILYRYSHPAGTIIHDKDYLSNDSFMNVAMAGFTAGTILSFFTAPMIMVKTKQQVTGNSFRQAFYETFRQIHQQPSSSVIASIRRCISTTGFGPHFISETAGRSAYYVLYEGLKRSMMARGKSRYHCDDDQCTNRNRSFSITNDIQIRMLSAALSGIICWSVIFPLDAIRSRMFAQSSSSVGYANHKKTTLEMVRSMYYESGPSGSLRPFYRGFGVALLRAGPVGAAVMPIYDFALEWLSSL